MKDFIIKLKEFSERAAAEQAKLPFHFNIIDELHASENAHTRILQRVLLYFRDGHWPFLESFLSDVLHIDCEPLKAPAVTFNQEFIDLLIEDTATGFACIVENKINNAGDQDKQLERYIEAVKAHGAKTIYAVYLTADGSKKVTSCSLTAKAKKELEWAGDEDTGRLVLINYKNDILPWLKEEVAGSCPHREEKMIAGIEQYIDHLEGLFGMRKEQREMNESLKKLVTESFGITGTAEEVFQKISECEKLAGQFLNVLAELKTTKAEDDPWKLPAAEKAAWLARKLHSVFKKKDQALPFTSTWNWDNDTFVLDKWKLGEHVIAIDVSCAALTKRGMSIAVRHAKKDEYKKIYSEKLAHALAPLGFASMNGKRFKKLLPEVNNDEDLQQLMKTIEAVLSILKTVK